MFKSSYGSPSSSSLPFIDFPDALFCSGDLQDMNGSLCDGASSGVKIGRYSANDRRERIERYRRKRKMRNFRKKITNGRVKYACRKTLADSRPRVRGRFAKNEEAELETESPESGEAGSDWWRKMKSALMTTGDEYDYDEDLWASLESVFAMNPCNTPLL